MLKAMTFSLARRAHSPIRSALLRGTGSIAAISGIAFASCATSGDAGSSPNGDSGAGGGALFNCAGGEFSCDGDMARSCDGNGNIVDAEDCSASNKICSPILGCIACIPGTESCENGIATRCVPNGGGFRDFVCDTTQGMVCEALGCRGACSPGELESSYLGCDYYPTITPNPVWNGFRFAVAVANAGDLPTVITLDRGSLFTETYDLAPGELKTIELPWVDELKGGEVNACQVAPAPGGTGIVPGGAYHLRSDQPITVYQLSPLRFEQDPIPDGCPLGNQCPGYNTANLNNDRCLSYSNDASLLLPSTTLGRSYTSLGWPSTQDKTGFLTITATEDNTDVELFGRGSFIAGAGITTTGEGSVRLQQGDVLQLLASGESSGGYGSDISGTRVVSSAPIQVIAGNSCANIPEATTNACDHIEHVVFPIETLGTSYLVTFPAVPAARAAHVVRIATVEDNTTVTGNPPVPGAMEPITLTAENPILELGSVTQDIEITSDQAILVAHYLQGEESVVENRTGDPSMAFAVPPAQFRTDYLFVASNSYRDNFVNVIAPSGSAVELDGQFLEFSEFEAIGDSGYSVARHQLNRAQETHRISADETFGIVVYGYGTYTSYLYPGGMDLEGITQSVIY